MTEIGPIAVTTEVSLLSLYLAYPQEGHLKAALYVMAYLGEGILWKCQGGNSTR